MPLDPTIRPVIRPAETGATRPVQIAQGGEPRQLGAPSASEATTSQPAEEKYDPGKPGDATMLFYNSLLVVALMVIFALSARKNLQKIPKGFSNFAEWVAECLNSFTTSVIGPEGEQYTPLIGTIFLYILLMNLLGLVPGFHSPTANVTFTLTMGISVFFYVQYVGIRNNGLGGHISHFMGPKILLFGKEFQWAFPLMLPVEILSECFRPLTLAVRLFGNIFGEDVIMFVLAGLGAASLASAWMPFHLPILLLAILTSLVQAMVFSTLACIYITLVSHHDEEHHEDHQHAEGAHETAPAQATH